MAFRVASGFLALRKDADHPVSANGRGRPAFICSPRCGTQLRSKQPPARQSTPLRANSIPRMCFASSQSQNTLPVSRRTRLSGDPTPLAPAFTSCARNASESVCLVTEWAKTRLCNNTVCRPRDVGTRRLRKNSDRRDRRPPGLKPIVDSARFTRR